MPGPPKVRYLLAAAAVIVACWGVAQLIPDPTPPGEQRFAAVASQQGVNPDPELVRYFELSCRVESADVPAPSAVTIREDLDRDWNIGVTLGQAQALTRARVDLCAEMKNRMYGT